MIRVALLMAGLVLAACGGESATPTPPAAVPPVECVGIPAATCQTIVNDARSNADPGTVPVRIRAVCGNPPCTVQEGDVDVEVRYSNGRTDRYSMGWAGAAGPGRPAEPTLPVEPGCEGVPIETCRDMAISAVTGVTGGPAVTAILVRCSGACSDLRGTGETILTYADGSTTSASWEYANSAP